MSALVNSNPAYKAITLLRADWDTYKDSPVATELAVPRRSTLVMFNQGEEVGRLVAQTNADVIDELFKKALP